MINDKSNITNKRHLRKKKVVLINAKSFEGFVVQC